MSAPYDETFEEFERRTGLNAFFGEYSTEVRGKLLSKNLKKPTDIYDVIYPQTRQDLLSKNVSIKYDMDKATEEIRNSLLAKHVSNQVSLEESGELQRKRILSKNKLVDSAESLEDLGEESRRKAKSRNKSNKANIYKKSGLARNSNIKRNVPKENTLLQDSELIRNDSLSKNVVKDNDPYNKIEDASSVNRYREENLKKNIGNETDLNVASSRVRTDNLSKNIKNNNDLLEDSESLREVSLSNNVPKESSIEIASEDFRSDSLSKNKSEPSDLERTNSINREENLKKNVNTNSDLEKDSNAYKTDNLSKNSKLKNESLEDSSLVHREDDLSKNEKNNTDLESSSAEIREDNLSSNKPIKQDLESSSSVIRNANLSNNDIKISDLESGSEKTRDDNLSNNDSILTDLESGSVDFLDDNLSNNTSVVTDLEKDSSPIREDVLSNNVPINTDLEKSSIPIRDEDLSNNSPIVTNLESDSTDFLDDNLSSNSPIVTNLESDSTDFLDDNLSNNAPIITDLEADSGTFRSEDLSANENIITDLEADSGNFLDDNLSSNSSNISDLETDSSGFLGENLSSNVPIDSDLETDSAGYRAVDLSSNVSLNTDLESDSLDARNQNLGNNVSIQNDLVGKSKRERDEQLSANDNKIQSVFLSGFIFRNLQMLRNDSRFSLGDISGGVGEIGDQARFEQTAQNNYKSYGKESSDGAGGYTYDDEKVIEDFNDKAEEAGDLSALSYPGIKALEINTNTDNNGSSKYFSTNLKNSAAGNEIDNGLVNYSSPTINGSVSGLISLHNIQQNTYQSRPGIKYEAGSQSAYNSLQSVTLNEFQKLLSIGGFGKRLQPFTNTTPQDILNANDGKYIGTESSNLDIKEILKPEEGELGTGLSMASQSDTSDVITQQFEKQGLRSRGVRFIIDKIKNDESVTFGKNFEVQGTEGQTSEFIFGKQKDGTPKKGYNRYSIKNPYAPSSALDLQFSFTNYAITDAEVRTMVFPAYIKSFQNGDKASWNSTTFLGRPEPIFTYGHSSRDGSITFFILTDYTEEVMIGHFYDGAGAVSEEFFETNKNFTRNPNSAASNAKSIDAEIARNNEIIQDPNTSGEEKESLSAENRAKENQKGLLNNLARTSSITPKGWSENNAQGISVYRRDMKEFQIEEREGNDIETKAADTITKLQAMNDELIFQPSFFSGSKVDFVERVEFMSKMTRPARNNSVSDGFSFTNPPVCHLHLGDWFNHDIIVDSVSYNYDGAPWTTDGIGKVYPMWCEVTIQFNIIGGYGADTTQDPPLATDTGGFMGRRRTI